MQETIRHLLSGFAPPVLFAYLIGSHGSQDEGPLSDVDIAIYLDLDSTADGLSL
ncbi:MAG: nucleotidyltransferase domain-containing protein [Desulfohalobiaceae bacterium]